MLLFFRRPQNVPLEVWLKLIALSLGIIGGWWVAPNIPFHNAEHIMIFDNGASLLLQDRVLTAQVRLPWNHFGLFCGRLSDSQTPAWSN